MFKKILVLIACAGLTACTVSTGAPSASSASNTVARAASAQGYALGILMAVNAERAKKGLGALAYNDALAQAARRHEADMTAGGFFSHTGSNGSSPSARVKAQGYKSCLTAENISRGYPNAQAVVAAWMQSDGHRRNILHRNVQQLGVAAGAGNTVVTVFANPC